MSDAANPLGDLRRPPPVVRWIVGIILVLALVRLVLPDRLDAPLMFYGATALSFGGAFQPQRLYTLVTGAFLHGGLLHAAMNVLWILVLGPVVCRRLGTLRFVAFYLTTAAAGGALHMALNWQASPFLVGASGAVFGRIGAGAYVLLRPRPGHAKVTWRDYVQYLVLFVVLNLGYAAMGPMFGGGGRISWEGHLGGFAAGLVLYPLLAWGRPSPGAAGTRGRP